MQIDFPGCGNKNHIWNDFKAVLLKFGDSSSSVWLCVCIHFKGICSNYQTCKPLQPN